MRILFVNAVGPIDISAVEIGTVYPLDIADIGNYEAQQNPDSGLFDTNPYGLLSQRGAWVVADAGGNSLLRLEGSGEDISTLAVFSSRAQGRRFNGVLSRTRRLHVGAE